MCFAIHWIVFELVRWLAGLVETWEFFGFGNWNFNESSRKTQMRCNVGCHPEPLWKQQETQLFSSALPWPADFNATELETKAFCQHHRRFKADRTLLSKFWPRELLQLKIQQLRKHVPRWPETHKSVENSYFRQLITLNYRKVLLSALALGANKPDTLFLFGLDASRFYCGAQRHCST